jgi:DNA ligase-1
LNRLDRGKLDDLLAVTISSKEDKWRGVTYRVFDAPTSTKPFEERREFLSSLTLPPHAVLVDYEKCQSAAHLQEKLKHILSIGGEGLMLRKPTSLYEHGRSSSFLKVKSYQDTEVRMVERSPYGFVCEQ